MELIEQRINSVEVAGMIDKDHAKLLRDIRNYITQLGEAKIGFTDFFVESTYQTEQNKTMPCYQVTKKGCEFIAHKLTCVKGTEFTARYIERFHEMEDTIRNHIPQGKELMALAYLEAQKTLDEYNVRIMCLEPKAAFADAVMAAGDAILIGELAKIISQNGYPIGQNQLFDWMREKGYLIKRGQQRNMPMQRYVEQGLFQIQENTVNFPEGTTRLRFTTKVTTKGQQYFINKFLGK